MKITLRVPNDLKDRMDAVEGVNWSAVAREAFARELDEIDRREKAENAFVVVMALALNKSDPVRHHEQVTPTAPKGTHIT